MSLLGISAFYHDSAACFVREGKVVSAAQEERFDRRKNSSAFPLQAINWCVQAAGLTVQDVEHIAFYEKPYLKFARTVTGYLESFPFSLPGFLRTMPHWLDERLSLPLLLKDELGHDKAPYFVKHHLSHAAAAFYPSPFEEAAVLTVDGVGEYATATWGTGKGGRLEITEEIPYPHSLGLLYTSVTTFLGFSANEGEGTTMALAAMGKPALREKLGQAVRVFEDGSIWLDERYFSFSGGGRMWTRRFEREFGPPRAARDPLKQEHCDLAASVQGLLEDALVKMARHLHARTGYRHLCFSGGVALNCVANAKILEETPFESIFVPPSPADAGGAVGAALYLQHHILGRERHPTGDFHAYLGPSFSDREILTALKHAGLAHRKLEEDALCSEVARKIFGNRIVGWFRGAMEFGPRALGNRSILANPCHAGAKEALNARIKGREPFRPFAPMVLAERAGEYFELDQPSPFMLFAPKVRPGIEARIPAVVHVDGTARVQTVDEANPPVRKLLQEFEKLSGLPILLNTSFNQAGEPIVHTPRQAIDCFRRSGLDDLVIGHYLVERE